MSIPGWEGAVGPFTVDYDKSHVYARDVFSGAGNCVCGAGLGAWKHIQAAPGVPIPDSMRYGTPTDLQRELADRSNQ